MARINLLPWREERRKQRNNEFYVILGLAFAVVAGLPGPLTVAFVSLFVVLGDTWLALIWLGVTREFDTVLKGYGIRIEGQGSGR